MRHLVAVLAVVFLPAGVLAAETCVNLESRSSCSGDEACRARADGGWTTLGWDEGQCCSAPAQVCVCGEPCAADSDCGGTARCEEEIGVCVQLGFCGCASDADCLAGDVCVVVGDGLTACMPPHTVCTTDADC